MAIALGAGGMYQHRLNSDLAEKLEHNRNFTKEMLAIHMAEIEEMKEFRTAAATALKETGKRLEFIEQHSRETGDDLIKAFEGLRDLHQDLVALAHELAGDGDLMLLAHQLAFVASPILMDNLFDLSWMN